MAAPTPVETVAAPMLPVGEAAPAGTLLFVTGPSALLSTDGGRLRVSREEQTVVELPWQQLQGIVLLGTHHLTTPALRAALEQQVPIHFATRGGRYQGVAWSGQPGPEGPWLWLQQQNCFADPARALQAAGSVVEARLRHSREVLRQRAVDQPMEAALAGIDQLLPPVAQAADLSGLNGLEGQGARLYFEALRAVVPAEFGFQGRTRRPPRDPFNALLSLGYTILFAQVDTVVRADGLLPWVGFYHQPHGRHAVLASDLMEPFRHLVERTALAAVTRRRLKVEDFYLDAERGCLLQPEALKRYLAMLSERFDTPLLALGGEVPKTLHGHLHDQNLALLAWIRGRTPQFTAWRMR
jgi:CRISPR-associated endonuclease Cas1